MSHVNDEGGLVLDESEQLAVARYAVIRQLGRLDFEWEDTPALAENIWFKVAELCESISAGIAIDLRRLADVDHDSAELWASTQ